MYVKKLICLASFVLVLCLVGSVQAAWITWTDAGPDQLWSTPANWDTGTVPDQDLVRMNMLPGPIIAEEGAAAGGVYVGYGGTTGQLTVDGGTLYCGRFEAGKSPNSYGIINMLKGSVNCSVIYVGQNGSGTINMIGGTITCRGAMNIPAKSSVTGHVNLDGGVITTNSFRMRSPGIASTMDIRGGTLIIDGDVRSTVQEYIDDPNGGIIAYDGQGTLHLDYDVTNEGKTTLKATHFLNPNPADSGLVAPGEMELSWNLPDPCVPGQPVSVDVYFTDDLTALQWFTDPAAMQVVNKQNVTSVVVQIQPKTRYYWAVDTYIGDPNDPIFGPIFSFFADNAPPEVDAGKDVVTWLVDGARTGNLDGNVTDDGAISPYTVQWTVVSEPNDPNNPDAVIVEPSAEDTSITLSALGEYVLQLEAFDGEYTGSDTVTINVYNDGCEAAQLLPDYEPIPGDINGDCIVDDLDLAILQENWLKDNPLIEEIYLD